MNVTCFKPSVIAFFTLLFFNSIGQNCTSITQSLIDIGLVSPNGCTNTEVGDPFLFFENSDNACDLGIERYLSRSISMEDMVDFNLEHPCWSSDPSNPYPAEANCSPPYDLCNGNYCPEIYAKNIEMLTEVNAQLIVRATSAWSKEGEFHPGGSIYEKSKQLVCDINAAYDCAGLRRPVIQAKILEAVGGGINNLNIPADILSEFQSEMTQGELLYYFNPDGSPKTLTYDITKMYFPISGGDPYYSINKVETRMWLYHQAKIFLDFGYKAFHMGIYWIYSRNEEGHDPGYVLLYGVLDKIRQYASGIGSFVLLNGEVPGANGVDGGESPKFGDTNLLLFDFDSRAMRPREVSTPQVTGDNGTGICDNPISPADPLAGTPCENEAYPAIVDFCVRQLKVNS